MDFGTYTSEEETIMHDGTILSKIGVTDEEITSKLSFNVTIKLVSGTSYTGNILIELPVRKHNDCGNIKH